jgi:hypothetical protein
VRRWWRPLSSVAGLALLVWLIARQPYGEIAAAFAELGWAVLLLLPAIGFTWFAANTSGLSTLLAGRAPWTALLVNRLMGEGYNTLVPSGSLAGEPLKVSHLSRWVPPHQSAVALIGDRLANAASGFVASAVCLVVALSAYAWTPTLRGLVLAWIGVAVLASGVVSWLALSHVPARLSGVALRWLGREVLAEMEALDGRAYLRALGWNLLGRASGLLEIAALLFLLDLPAGAAPVAAIGGLLLASGLVGLVVPQGFGVFEAASAWAFTLVGYPAPAGLCFGLARRGRMLFFSLLGVALHLGRRGAATRPADRPA